MFRLRTHKLFLTYPRCDLSKEEVRDFFINKFGDKLEHYVIAREKHENGLFHIHCYIQLKNEGRHTQFDTTDEKCLDIGQYHGNYQGARSMKRVVQYVTKDEDFLSDLEIDEITNKVPRKQKIARKIVEENLSLIEVLNEFPDLIFGYKKLKYDITEWKNDVSDKRLDLPPFIPNPWGKVMPSKIFAKKRHYWIFSRQPNKGKTYLFAKPLYKEYKCAIQSGSFDYWNIRGDEQMLIIDEYNSAKLKFSDINAMADGIYGYKVIYSGLKRLDDPLIIFLSNVPINELYPNMNFLLYERFREIEL